MAVVAYDTALEALQAISMFNGQTLFDRNMSVKMDRLANMEEKKPALPGSLLGYTVFRFIALCSVEFGHHSTISLWKYQCKKYKLTVSLEVA